MEPLTNDGLPLEYKLKYGYARGYLRLSDIMDDAPVFRIPGIFGYSFPEEVLDFSRVRKPSAIRDNACDSHLVRND